MMILGDKYYLIDKYYVNDKDFIHREDGPAVIYGNGDKEWWIDGYRIDVSLKDFIIGLFQLY